MKSRYGITKVVDDVPYWLKRIEPYKAGVVSRTVVWTREPGQAMRFETLKAARRYAEAEDIRGGKAGTIPAEGEK